MHIKSAAKITAEHGKPGPKRHRPCFLKQENYTILNTHVRFYILYNSQYTIDFQLIPNTNSWGITFS